MYDVLIVGAGPAGLSAALMLGRSRRNVLICDDKQPRNAPAHAMHGFLTRDGISPAEFLRLAREDLYQYTSLEWSDMRVENIEREGTSFSATLADGSQVKTRKVLLATGVLDALPDIEGCATYFGSGVYNCPYCSGWEVRDERIAVYGYGKAAWNLALQMLLWSRDIVLCAEGPLRLNGRELLVLAQQNIMIIEDPVVRVEGDGHQLTHLVLANNTKFPVRALFFNSPPHHHSALPQRLGFGRTPLEAQEKSIPGVYIAGEAAHTRWVSGAVADGAEVAIEINKELLLEDIMGIEQVI